MSKSTNVAYITLYPGIIVGLCPNSITADFKSFGLNYRLFTALICSSVLCFSSISFCFSYFRLQQN